MRPVLRTLVRDTLLLAATLGGAHAALADPLADVREMVKAGRAPEALRTLDTLIAQRPSDAQLRFQKGVLLVDQKRSAEAIVVFQRLGQDFPALPEPFNNLAVIYVEQGQLEKARTALESAIRSRPNYGTAFQNLGDVYTRMASRAYARALQIEDPEAAPKLALIRELYDMPEPVMVAAAPAATAASRVVAPATPAASAPEALPPVAAVSAATPPSTPQTGTDVKAVTAAVGSWADAWSRKDLDGYFGAYVNGFKGSESSASAWRTLRRDRITGKRRISVELDAIKVETAKDIAKVSFRQTYVADLLRVSSRKTLELEQHNGKWLIRKESNG